MEIFLHFFGSLQWLIVSLQKGDMVKLLKEYDTAAAESFCRQEEQPAPEVGSGLQPKTMF